MLPPPPQPRGGRPRTRGLVASDLPPISVAVWAAQQPRRAWRHVTWRNGQNRPWAALFVAIRVTPVGLWRRKQRLHDVWLLCQRAPGATTASKHDKYFCEQDRKALERNIFKVFQRANRTITPSADA